MYPVDSVIHLLKNWGLGDSAIQRLNNQEKAATARPFLCFNELTKKEYDTSDTCNTIRLCYSHARKLVLLLLSSLSPLHLYQFIKKCFFIGNKIIGTTNSALTLGYLNLALSNPVLQLKKSLSA